MDKAHVLIVDDEKELLLTLKDALGSFGSKFQMAFATNITKAKEILNKFKVDTIVTDVKMPGGTGIDLLLFIRKNFPHIKIIIMTAYGDEEMKRNVLYHGAYAFMEKPLDIKQLGRLIVLSLEEKKKDNFLGKLSLFDILQFMGLSSYSGAVFVEAAGSKKGVILIQSGNIIDASTPTNKNIAAISEMARWQNIEISTGELPADAPTTSLGTIQSVLMRCAKIVDESAS